MNAILPKATTRRSYRRRFVLGSFAAATLLLGVAEVFLRTFPPRDLHPFLGEDSPLTGIYAPDADLGMAYRSYDDFARANAKRLKPWLPLDSPPERRPIWAMFGNSFVHMDGQLADTARATVKDRAIFNLGLNEHLPIRVAQVRLLLDQGFRPERIFFSVMPVDFYSLAEQPLETIRITERGGLTYEPRLPPAPLGWCVRESRLALTAWCRTGLQRGNPFFSRSRLPLGLDEPMLGDARRLMSCLAEVTKKHSVPVTVMLLPAYQHVCDDWKCGFQDDLTPMLRELGCDVFDPRDAFRSYPDKPNLFIPDKHFSREGNLLLLAELLAHLGRTGTSARVGNALRGVPQSAVPQSAASPRNGTEAVPYRVRQDTRGAEAP
jgi:hypothetical protein